MKKSYNITVTKTGYGHWSVTTTHYGKTISATITDSQSIDDYQAWDDDRRHNRGARELRRQVINKQF